MKYYTLLAAVMITACQPGDEGHSHETAGGHSHATEQLIKKTVITDSLEVYLEFPPLSQGTTSTFEIHLTKLKGFQPLVDAQITLSLIQGPRGIRQTVDKSHSLGVYSPALQPKTSGLHSLQIDIVGANLQEKIVLDNISVYENREQALSGNTAPPEPPDLINFSKEQAWNIEFRTQPATSGQVFDVIHTSGVWKATPEGYKLLNATASGVVNYAIDNLTEGTVISKGQLLMSISSEGFATDNLQAAISKAEADFQLANSEYQRKKALLEEKIIAQAEFEQVENKYKVALTSLETLRAGYSAGSKQITTPFEGFVQSIEIDNGDYVEQGDELLTIGTSNARILEAQVSPAFASKLNTIHNIWYQVKPGIWSDIQTSGGEILSVGQEIASDQPLIPLFAKVNERVESPLGGITEVQIALGGPRASIVIPESALLEDYGVYSVMVQVTGEQYQRRQVSVGRRNGATVEILQGLREHEIVVTAGTFQVKMAGMADQAPGHGHSH
ncbi:MAG: efflux RND transporter periplasmic adaptor subunit [Cyclobacteriaceae bacterium]|nr:efflux RND transporter periplasmic adaptor subunit [Cyclobacteriaceae bacterium]